MINLKNLNKVNLFLIQIQYFKKSKKMIGYFLHGLKLKSYTFDKYKTKKNKNNLSIYITGKINLL